MKSLLTTLILMYVLSGTVAATEVTSLNSQSVASSLNESGVELKSPDGRLSAKTNGSTIIVSWGGLQALELTDLNITHDPSSSTPFVFVKKVTDDYQMLTGKRKHCHNEANEYATPAGKGAKLVLRMYNDGVALRYEFADEFNENEKTGKGSGVGYRIKEGTQRWMQQWAESYEGFFPQNTTYKVKPVPSFSGTFKSADGWNNRWGYPALIEAQKGVFVLISEANIERGQSASSLYNDGEVFRVVEAERIRVTGETSEQSLTERNKSGKGHTPWRMAIIGTLKDVVESTLVTDVSEPCRIEDTSWIEPGVVSWIYWAYNHGSNDYNIIKQYVDMAVKLRLPYVLIDAEWDEMRDGRTIEDAVGYAKSKGIKPLIWYNSSVGWIDGAPGPKFRLNKPEDREKEFAWCEKIGVAGVKIDFFSGDNQKNMDYCIDLLECAARHHLLVNFHGATIPRGWQRTYPNLMSTEGVYGAEWYNNVPTFTDKAAGHNATLPFTRNVIGPMDYTPCTFSDSQHPHITTNAHELALTVLFESGLQHLADKPESYLSQPKEVQQFLSELPSTWDETRFVSGNPGNWVVLARRKGTTWYVAGINGLDTENALLTNLDFINPDGKTSVETILFMDGDGTGEAGEYGKNAWNIMRNPSLANGFKCRPRGGFVLVVHQKSDTLPFVYDVENTGTSFPKPDMPAAKDLPVQHGLPDALKGVNSFADWAKRRSDIGHMIQHYGIGEKPAVSKEQVKAHMEGDTALVVDVTVNGETLTLRSVIHYPKTGTAPYPLMIGTSMMSLPRQLFNDRPIAIMNFREKQVNDYGQWGKHHERGEHPFDKLYPQLKDNGAYSEWAWGLSRLIDGLQQLGPEVTKIDTRHIGVTGCSYAGKMALYCGAFDERIALTIAQEPGGGGAAAWRKSHESTEKVEDIDKTDYHWFLESQKDNFQGDSVYRLPYDQHELCTMVCPRALLLLGNPDYPWLSDPAMEVSAKAAVKVWQNFGIGDRMDWSIVGGHGHCMLPESQYPIVQSFIDRFLLGRSQ